MSQVHPGFKAVQKKIARKYGMKRAGAILASATRRASPEAKQTNPRLKRVKGMPHDANTPVASPQKPQNAFDRARAYLKRVKGR